MRSFGLVGCLPSYFHNCGLLSHVNAMSWWELKGEEAGINTCINQYMYDSPPDSKIPRIANLWIPSCLHLRRTEEKRQHDHGFLERLAQIAEVCIE